MTLRILVADDSPIFREIVKDVLEFHGEMTVVAEAVNGEEAVRLAKAVRPDLILIDLRMPGMDGLAAIERIMAEAPTPILVVTASAIGPGSGLVFEAMSRGALELLEKKLVASPVGAAFLRERVRQLSKVRVVRRMSPVAKAPPPVSSLPLLSSPQSGRVVALGASAGGPSAVVTLLRALPANFPVGVVLVQHLGVGFAEAFADYLRSSTALKVVTVHGRTHAAAGTVLVPPDDRHLVAAGEMSFEPRDGPTVRGHRPSVDVLFDSVAVHHGRAAVGVLLTGMGDDGAAGLHRIKTAGGLTLAQDEATSAVFGMPRAAIELGAAVRVVPLTEISAALIEATR